MTTQSGEIELIGPHEFKFVLPDEVHITVHGDFEPDHFDAHLVYLQKIARLCGGGVYCVVDARNVGRMTEALRKRMVAASNGYPYLACAVIGAVGTTRVVFDMVAKAGRVLAPKAFQFPIRFFPDVESAQQWFQSLRKSSGTSG